MPELKRRIDDDTLFPFNFKTMWVYMENVNVAIRKMALMLIGLYFRHVKINKIKAANMGLYIESDFLQLANHFDESKLKDSKQSKILEEYHAKKVEFIRSKRSSVDTQPDFVFYYFDPFDYSANVMD